MAERIYLCIDLKSFYASVECVDLGLNPITTNLVVADKSRSEKTICLAVTPALKSFGISGRPRLFEVMQKVKNINKERLTRLPFKRFAGKSYNITELQHNPSLALAFIAAPPRMAHYIKYSTLVYEIYLKYIAPEDIHVYSIDEVFIDITGYLKVYNMTPYSLAKIIVQDIYKKTGITATAGIGTNLYLAKAALDIMAKFIIPDEDGARIAYLDEMLYRHKLWSHKPITDFWRVGTAMSDKLEKYGIYTMGDIARCSISNNKFYNEELLYKLFGINAELLIDHAWGYEPCTIAHIKAYKPDSKSIGTAQVLHSPYTWEKARNAVKEMADILSLDLVEKELVTNQIILNVSYDVENLSRDDLPEYNGELKIDRYGRTKPKSAHGTINLENYTSSTKDIVASISSLYDSIADKNLWIRRINVVFNHVIPENTYCASHKPLTILDFLEEDVKIDDKSRLREKDIQKALIDIKKRFGKNAVIKGMNLFDGATTIDRNNQIGGHRA